MNQSDEMAPMLLTSAVELHRSVNNTSTSLPEGAIDLDQENLLKPPSDGEIFDDIVAAEEMLRHLTCSRGYGIARRRTRDSKDPESGERKLQAITYTCDRGGAPSTSESSESTRRRKRASLKCNCPFQFTLKRTSDSKWIVRVDNEHHTHPPSDSFVHHPSMRKLTESTKRIIEEDLANKLPPRATLSKLRRAGVRIMRDDIHNCRRALKRGQKVIRAPGEERARAKVQKTGHLEPAVDSQESQSAEEVSLREQVSALQAQVARQNELLEQAFSKIAELEGARQPPMSSSMSMETS